MAISNPNSQAGAWIRKVNDLIYADGFEAGSMYDPFTAGVSFTSSAARVTGSGQGMRFTTSDNGNGYIQRYGLQNFQEIMFGFAFRISFITGWARPYNMISFVDGIGGYQAGIGFGSDGRFYISRGASNNISAFTSIATMSATGLTPNVWYWVDGKMRFHGSIGYAELRINEQLVIQATSLNTRGSTSNNYANGFVFNGSDVDTNPSLDFDDFYIMDNSSNLGVYPGDVRAYNIVPTGDGNYTQWTPSTGTAHFATIDESPYSDTDYNQSNTVGNIDTYTFSDLPSNAQTVYGVMYAARAQKTDAGTRTLRFIQRQSSTDYERPNSDTNLPTNSFGQHIVYTDSVNPATNAAYTVADINSNAEFGIKVQS